MIYVLVFSSIFMVILTSFVTFIVTQSRLIAQRTELEQAGQIAEAGLNYYKWYLAHYPNSTSTSITGVYSDPELGPIGEYQLALASTTYCGTIMSRQVSSIGYTYKMPDVRRTMSARYARPNVAEFSFIINSNVWAGPDRTINGPYHSNGGVRMDGTHNSSVTSGQATWSCNSSYGCTPTVNRNGVFTTTANANAALFEYPTTPVNFGSITVDLSDIETRARTGGGVFLGPSGGANFGYHVTFNSTSSITVRRVTGTQSYWGYSTESGWQTERHVITSTSTPTTYTISNSCPVIAIQDKVWLQGVVPNKVTIAASHATSTTNNPSIILLGNITYTSPTTSGLLAIAEEDVLIGVNVPTALSLNGIFIAKNGHYGRNHYCTNCDDGGNKGLPSSLDPFVFRNSETHNGTIVSNGRVGTQWTSGGVPSSGFLDRYTSYDRNLVENPPPFIPETSDTYEFSDWRDAN
jgi:hypothetical protein